MWRSSVFEVIQAVAVIVDLLIVNLEDSAEAVHGVHELCQPGLVGAKALFVFLTAFSRSLNASICMCDINPKECVNASSRSSMVIDASISPAGG